MSDNGTCSLGFLGGIAKIIHVKLLVLSFQLVG